MDKKTLIALTAGLAIGLAGMSSANAAGCTKAGLISPGKTINYNHVFGTGKCGKGKCAKMSKGKCGKKVKKSKKSKFAGKCAKGKCAKGKCAKGKCAKK